MNVLIFSEETAQLIIEQQAGMHRLGPVSLTDNRYFLSEDVLTEPHFQLHLQGKVYDVLPYEEIKHLLPVTEEPI